jgi:uncharacterized protein YjiS (DUF1127 family)
MSIAATRSTANAIRWTETIKALWRVYREGRARRRAVADLRRLDPRVLRDLAIDGSEIESVVFNGRGRRRFWTGR